MAEPGHLTDTERERILQLLHRSQEATLDHIADLSEAQWMFKHSGEKWSIGETAEHLALLEPLITNRLASALEEPADPDWEAKETNIETMEAGLLNRARGFAAPEILHPKSNISHAQVISNFRDAREKTIAFAASDLPLKRHFAPHPLLGNLNLHAWLAALAFHNMRHNLQIAEVKSLSGYPT